MFIFSTNDPEMSASNVKSVDDSLCQFVDKDRGYFIVIVTAID
jgi:hypothetical protein